MFEDLDSLRRWATAGEAGFSLLICVGGDGTQSMAAGAAMRRSVPFVPVPSGFGNLFAGALGHSPRVDHVLEVLEAGEIVRVDVGVRAGELFLCQEGFGLLSDIQRAGGSEQGEAASPMAARPVATSPRLLSGGDPLSPEGDAAAAPGHAWTAGSWRETPSWSWWPTCRATAPGSR